MRDQFETIKGFEKAAPGRRTPKLLRQANALYNFLKAGIRAHCIKIKRDAYHH
jgi:hypothetical protein